MSELIINRKALSTPSIAKSVIKSSQDVSKVFRGYGSAQKERIFKDTLRRSSGGLGLTENGLKRAIDNLGKTKFFSQENVKTLKKELVVKHGFEHAAEHTTANNNKSPQAKEQSSPKDIYNKIVKKTMVSKEVKNIGNSTSASFDATSFSFKKSNMRVREYEYNNSANKVIIEENKNNPNSQNSEVIQRLARIQGKTH